MSTTRDTSLDHLHPIFREKVKKLLERLEAEKLPFRLFEGFRSPGRQRYLYEQGRTRPGNRVTNARPWSSFHQYGVAADFVLFENGRWSWDDRGEKSEWWKRLHVLGEELGLKPLSWEKPHLEMVQMNLTALRSGQFPLEGDLSWAENLEGAIYSWSGPPAGPPLPGNIAHRPPLDNIEITTVLKLGSRGAEVTELQRRLKKRGFHPGMLDGIFGPAVEAAVKAYQKSEGLLADGIVGPKTLSTLELASGTSQSPSMPLLRVGASGDHVERLQKRLSELGFDPGQADGIFGPKTEAALTAFQEEKNLTVDGIAGPKTWAALQLEPAEGSTRPSSPLDEGVSVSMVARMFPDAPLHNIKKYLPYVLRALEKEDLLDRNMVLMALATIRAETAGFEPISEFRSRYNTSPAGHPFDLYDYRKDLGNQGPPDGERFKGRGFIQLTGRYNYEKYGQALGLGKKLVENPELANDPDTAAKLLAKFLKDREREIKEALLDGSLATARRLVNGGRHGLNPFSEAFSMGDTLLA